MKPLWIRHCFPPFSLTYYITVKKNYYFDSVFVAEDSSEYAVIHSQLTRFFCVLNEYGIAMAVSKYM